MRHFAFSILLWVAGCGASDKPFAVDLGDGGSAPDLASLSPADLAGFPDQGTPGPAATLIRVHYPAPGAGHSISIRGDALPLDWNKGVPLAAGGADTFVYTLPALDHPAEFKPLLDDTTWSHGANYRVLPGETVDVYPHFTSTHGQVVKLIAAFQSQALNNSRRVWAYLPASYDENPTARYPVLYMHDGQNLFDPKLAFGGNEWMVDETLDAAAEGQDRALSIREIIVVGPENTANRIWEYTPTKDVTVGDGGGGALYLKMLVEELKPSVDKMLRTLPDPAHTGILGSSLGGLISAYAGVTRPATWGLVGAMSPSTWWDGRTIIADVQGTAGKMPRPQKVYLDSGDSGTSNDDVVNTRDLSLAYLKLGYTEGLDFHYLVQMGGQHNEVYWSERLPGALRFLVGTQSP